MPQEELPQGASARLPAGAADGGRRKNVSVVKLKPIHNLCVLFTFSKERIELRGAIAKDVSLDVQIFRPQHRLNLLETIIANNKRYTQGKLHFQMTRSRVLVYPLRYFSCSQ